MATNNNPTIRQRRLARRLRELRTAAGMTHADTAEILGSAESKVGRIENALSGVRLPDLRALMDAYGVINPAERAAIEQLSRQAKQKGWWSRYSDTADPAYAAYIAVESDAAKMYSVQIGLVPGLLQTPEYFESLARLLTPDITPEALKAQVDIRRERRTVLTRENPLQLWAIIAESVLYHRVGGRDVMKGQLEALIEESQRPNVQLQVLPREDPMNACLFGPFVIFGFPNAAETEIVYTEALTSGLYYEEDSEVETYSTLLRRLNIASANAGQSRDLIENALKEMG
ncbi:helix-turn-helix domain-containing protein [Streptomyces sp. NBC_00872]|uniref:helix-turn-helix domain-containing protein n=1 Tax=Streptomyces sp. NBC_00872 TaxID=2903686 RepID=UPI003870249A|nr:helix-turn-helix domain-containing protein [Streptomyces sp. NBC_00872]